MHADLPLARAHVGSSSLPTHTPMPSHIDAGEYTHEIRKSRKPLFNAGLTHAIGLWTA
jgi:hypothetical protein